MYGSSILIIVLCVVLICCAGNIGFWIRRKICREKVCRMCTAEKLQILQELAEPFGYYYLPEEDIFTTRIDAWQRLAGYEAFFDRAAEHFNMVFDAWPVYFNYEGRTWLIELWKGQYGINTGAEIGIYHANGIVAEKERKKTHFHAAENCEMPGISYCLEKNGKTLLCVKRLHWWLAAFRMGEFSRPSDLSLTASLHFRERCQAERFYEALTESGQPRCNYRLRCNEVYVRMDFSPRLCWCRRICRAYVQRKNRICCKLYCFVTRPFCNTVDRMLYLYFLLPRCFRRMMRMPRRWKRRYP